MSNVYERELTIDIFRGIGILFVIIGHAGDPKYGGYSILNYVYNFHMPLFFVISGYLYYSNSNFMKYIYNKAKSILVPYVVLFFVSFLITNTLYPLSQGLTLFCYPFQWIDLIKGLILSGGYLEKIPINNFPLWYLPLSFIATACFYGVEKIWTHIEKIIRGGGDWSSVYPWNYYYSVSKVGSRKTALAH